MVLGVTLLRVLFAADSGLNLDFEEAQYWLWAQSPAWGYYSKPPMVAWLIAATTHVCGNSEFCVRLASPLLHGLTALVLGALGTTLGGPVLGFWSAVGYATLPGVALSAILITTDVPLLLCWALALLAFARWLDTARWPWAAACGLALGAGLLSKYSAIMFLPCAVLYLALSGRRLRPRHALLATAVAFVIVAPNATWNLGHDFGTVRHTISRMQPGVSSFRPDEPLLFVLAQLVVFGPVLCGWLFARELRFWRSATGDRRLLLGAFTVPPLALAIVVSIVARANANWAAPAYVAGTVLVAGELLRAHRLPVLRAALAVNVSLGLLLYLLLATVPVLRLPGGSLLAVRARLEGWDELGRRTAARAAALGDARILVDLRELLAVAGYYGHVPEERLVEWAPTGAPHSQFALRTHLVTGDPGPFLFVSYRPKPRGVTRWFEQAELVDTVVVALAPELERTHWLYALRGFRGYPPGRRSASFTPPGGVASVLWPGNTESPTRWSPGVTAAGTIDR